MRSPHISLASKASFSRLLPGRIQSDNFDLDPHIVLGQSRNPDTSPKRLMIWHPALEIPRHRCQRLIVKRGMI